MARKYYKWAIFLLILMTTSCGVLNRNKQIQLDQWKRYVSGEFIIKNIEYNRTYYIITVKRNNLSYTILSQYQAKCSNDMISLKKGMKVKLDIKCFYPSTNANFSHFHYFFTVEDGVSSDDIFTKKDTGYRFYHTSDIVSNYIYINRIIAP
ncbi:MAG: hypothetical protein IJG81_00680 [Muribaculaceae bacterium]|nr:hypothetical protein [Muribaculaceae bacterium]